MWLFGTAINALAFRCGGKFCATNQRRRLPRCSAALLPSPSLTAATPPEILFRWPTSISADVEGLFPFTLNIYLNHWEEKKKNNIWVKLLFAKSFSSHGCTPKSHFIRCNNFEIWCIWAAWLRFWTYMKISGVKWKQNSFTLTAALGRPSGCRMGAKHVSLPW